MKQKICIMGLPTVGLLANRGYHVHGVDMINQGNIYIVEPTLDIFVKNVVYSGHLKADITSIQADIFMMTVPTPFHKGYV